MVERPIDLTTKRCMLRPITAHDVEPLHELSGVTERLWGQGYAAEIAQAVLTYCVDSLHMPIVRASTDAANTASVRVLEKLGFQFVRRGTAGCLATVFYEMRPSEVVTFPPPATSYL